MARGRFALSCSRNLLAASLAVILLPVCARADPVAQFHAGVDAYGKGDYAAAVHAFEQARAEGLDRPALYYNLGSAYYRLGDYQRAKSSFEHLLTIPEMAPLAHYNLGLVARRRAEDREAQRHFRAAFDDTQDQRLRYLAGRQLPRPPRAMVSKHDWRGFASLGAGYDDNVNFAPTDMPTYRGDTFGELYTSGSGVLSGTRDDGLSVHASLYGLRYQDETENNFSELRLLARKDGAIGDWRTYAGGYIAHDTLAGDDYQRTFGIETAATRRLPEDHYLHIRYIFENIDTLDGRYDYLTGQRHDLLAQYEIYRSGSSIRVGYELELNDRRDTASESYSPTRHTIHADYSHDLGPDWNWRADASYRWSDYPNAPLLNRDDKRWRTRFSASRQLTGDWSLTGQWEFTENQSNDPLRDYQRNVYSVQLQWVF